MARRGAGIAFVAVLVAANPVAAETLMDALVQTFQTNPTLAAERARLHVTDEQIPQALSGYRPDVRINGDVGTEYRDTDSTSADGQTPAGAGIAVVQPIYRGGRTTAGIARAQNLIQSARARLFATEQVVLLDAVTVYMDLLRDQAVLDLAIHNAEVIEQQRKATQDRFDVGEVTRTDVAQAEARLAGGIADRVRAEGDVIASRAAYRRVIGADAGTPAPAEPLTGLPESEAAALDGALGEHPDVLAAAFAESAARDDIRISEGVLLPEVNLRASVDRGYDRNTFADWEDSAAITAEISIPLYQSGLRESQVRESKYLAAQRRLEVDEARRRVLDGVTQAWEDLVTSRAQVDAFQEAVRAAEIALDGLEKEALVGSRTVLDVLDGEQELFQARVDLVRAQRDVVVATFSLQSSVGRLSAQSLGLPVAPYDFDRYYRATRSTWWGTDVNLGE
ncbi:MAG: type I secretion protein TolC [Alphaproteobacteria bacterium]|nr:type I secretion protein TolC [Alphaproteobacteria bacterium]